jgi:serine/threonine protein kinase
LIKQIGIGNFGKVYLAKDSKDNEIAVKIVSKKNIFDSKEAN